MNQPIIRIHSFSALRFLIATAIGALCALSLSCSTVSGLGQDVEATGDALQHAAHDASHSH